MPTNLFKKCTFDDMGYTLSVYSNDKALSGEGLSVGNHYNAPGPNSTPTGFRS